MSTPICPYCEQEARLVDSAEVYNGVSYGLLWRCAPCNAHVGCHGNTVEPLGRLANPRLRLLKIKAHEAFDPSWQRMIDAEIAQRGFAPKGIKTKTRDRCYKQLAHAMCIPMADCHIGMFDEAQCLAAIAICNEWNQSFEGASNAKNTVTVRP